ncbi:MAG: sn-glycerol-1-phosphate dehydrogenase [Burkholderiaceae bacterium]
MSAYSAIAHAVAQSETISEISIGKDAIAAAGALFVRHFDSKRAYLVADENTWRAAGESLEAALISKGIACTRYILPGTPKLKPTVSLGQQIIDKLQADDAVPVAIGSGVINDLVKFAAFELGRPYFCVATAASMDGYASAGSPLSDAGFKKTIQCRPARVILADLNVMCHAPKAMTGWGYGDLAGKVPAGADWIVADALGIEAVDDVAWPMVQNRLREWLGAPNEIQQGRPAAIAGLFEGLTLVGLAMERHGSSRPASGADHQIAHLWEMEDLQLDGEPVSHGACVAIGCVAVLDLYAWLLEQDLAQIDVDYLVTHAASMRDKQQLIEQAFGDGEIARRSLAETAAKHVTPERLHKRLKLLQHVWPNLRERLKAQLLPPSTAREMLEDVGAPFHSQSIGIDHQRLQQSVANARFLRSRYTVLDLLDETGLLAAAISAGIAQRPEPALK